MAIIMTLCLGIEMLNQSTDNSHYCTQISFGDHGVIPGVSKDLIEFFIEHSYLLWDPSKKTQYLTNDSLYFRVTSFVTSHKPWLECAMTINPSLERILRKEEYLSENGMIIIKMPTYGYIKSLNDAFYSDLFYSSPSGYKLCLKVLANGEHDGKSTHLSVYLKVLKGPYDSSLKWPITGSVAFELLNQLKGTVSLDNQPDS